MVRLVPGGWGEDLRASGDTTAPTKAEELLDTTQVARSGFSFATDTLIPQPNLK